jgi:hypothetical protein
MEIRVGTSESHSSGPAMIGEIEAAVPMAVRALYRVR